MRPSDDSEVLGLAGMFRLLSRLWLREVDRDLLESLRESPLSEAFRAANGVVPEGDAAGVIDELAIDYCQLFVGPANHLPPFQSVWENGQLQDRPIQSMQQFAEVLRYDIESLPRGVMLDHLGIQLEVMAHLLSQRVSVKSAGERDALTEIEAAFRTSHLSWPASLLDAASRRADSAFYRSVIEMTREFLGPCLETPTNN